MYNFLEIIKRYLIDFLSNKHKRKIIELNLLYHPSSFLFFKSRNMNRRVMQDNYEKNITLISDLKVLKMFEYKKEKYM